jgi:hypothetical protein
MSNSYIPTKIKTKLWILSGGRCEYDGCNKPLWRDELSLVDMNAAYIAHIVADDPNGPRGDVEWSPKLRKEFSNLMLLCDVHHRIIDITQVTEHPVDRLQKMKTAHESRIELLTSVQPNRKSEILLFGADIGAHTSPLTYLGAAEAMLPDYYPASQYPIELGMHNVSIKDDETNYWKIQEDNLRRLFDGKVTARLQAKTLEDISVFALAPQPLLMLLGVLLGDITKSQVYQLHREPKGWKWADHPEDFAFKVARPEKYDGTPALIFSLSANITRDRIDEVLGSDCRVWSVSVDVPNNDFLRSKEQLAEFRNVMRGVLNEIKLRHGQNTLLHVFPAMAVSTAVEFGRILMPKADMPIRVYDQSRLHSRFVPALDLIK